MAIAFTGDATLNEKQPMPDGDYFLTVTDAEEKKSKKSGRDMIEMELTVAVGPFADKKRVKYWLTFIEAGSDGHGMTLHALHAFGLPHDGSINVSAEDFKGRTVKAKISSEPYGQYVNNVIKDFYILTDDQMAAEGSAAAGETAPEAAPEPPKPQPSAAAKVVFGKPAGKKLPWAK